MGRYYEVTVAPSESVTKMCVQRPLAEKSRWRHIWLAIKPRYLGNHASHIKSYYGTLIESHSSSFRISHVKQHEALLADKSRWRHIRLAIKPRYRGKHASQIKSYYGTLSESHDGSFIICHVKWREASPGVEIMMTSYPAWNKTSLSRKSCIADKELLWNAIRKSKSLFQNTSCKIAWSDP